jgi:hypothetical protein
VDILNQSVRYAMNSSSKSVFLWTVIAEQRIVQSSKEIGVSVERCAEES